MNTFLLRFDILMCDETQTLIPDCSVEFFTKIDIGDIHPHSAEGHTSQTSQSYSWHELSFVLLCAYTPLVATLPFCLFVCNKRIIRKLENISNSLFIYRGYYECECNVGSDAKIIIIYIYIFFYKSLNTVWQAIPAPKWYNGVRYLNLKKAQCKSNVFIVMEAPTLRAHLKSNSNQQILLATILSHRTKLSQSQQ